MVFKKLIWSLKTSYVNFYRPANIDDAVRRREILSIMYAGSSVCFFIYCVYRLFQLRNDEEFLAKAKPRGIEDGYILNIGGGKLFELIPPSKKGEIETSEK